MKRILIIQTAFIGDVILATPLVEKLHEAYPEYIIDFLLRKGNEGLFANHPYINKIYIWNKKEDKYRDLFNILMKVRQIRYDYIINLQRFLSTGIFTILSGSKIKIGFKKNKSMPVKLSSRFTYLNTSDIIHSTFEFHSELR